MSLLSRLLSRWKLWRALLHFTVGFFGVALGAAAAIRYRSLLSDWAFDLAFFHNLIASAARGAGFTQSASLHELDGLLNLSHAFFGLPLFVPLYWVVPQLDVLLLAQGVAMAAGAWPVARLTRAAGGSDAVGLCMALVYLSSFALWRVGLADLRPLMLVVPCLLWVMAALVERRTWEVALAGLITCLWREEAPVLLVALASSMWLFRQTDRRPALAAINLGVAYFILLMWLRPRMSFYVPFHDPAAIVQGIGSVLPEGVPLWRPATFLLAYVPLGALPGLLVPGVWLSSLPLLAYLFLMSPYEWWHWSGPYVHHAAPLLAFSFGAAALMWGRLDARLRGRPGKGWHLVAPVTLALAALIQAPSTGLGVEQALGLADGAQALTRLENRNKALRGLIAKVPAQASLATDYLLIARMSGRPILYCYQSNFGGGGVDGSSGKAIPDFSDVQYVLMDDQHAEHVARLRGMGLFELVDSGGGYLLFRQR